MNQTTTISLYVNKDQTNRSPLSGSLPWLLIWLGFLVSCAHYPVTPRIDRTSPFKVMQEQFNPSYRSDELFILLAFSGGGTRAAALSYGILEALADVRIPGAVVYDPSATSADHRLLNEVDGITAVSGGSFTAAYYGLYGDRIFTDFRERFLVRNVQWDLILRLLNPVNTFRILSPYFARSDMAAEYYDRTLFEGKTLGDIRSQISPYILIQATDIVNGLNFPFSPYMLSLICSDYDAFPVSRAVAASAAFPGPFTPIVLENYAGTCNFFTEAWVHRAVEERDKTDRSYILAKKLLIYENTDQTPYIYLLDGGIADNLGLRSSLELIEGRGPESFRDAGIAAAKKIIFIIVNAASKKEYAWGRLGKIPGVGGILGATSSVMVDNTNYDTYFLLQSYFENWLETYGKLFPEKPKPKLYFAVIGFDDLSDASRRKYFYAIPTSLSLPEKTVDELRTVAKELLYNSGEFKRFVNDVGGSIPRTQNIDTKR